MGTLALLGTWHVHADWFLSKLEASGLGKVAVVWDEDEERGRAFAENRRLDFDGDLDRVLSNPKIDAVMVEAPTTKHQEIICKAAEAGKHIFSDKALALSTGDFQQIKAAIEKSGVKFLLSLESKCIAQYRYAQKLVEEGKLGRVTSAYFRRAHQAALDPNMLPAYWFDTKDSGGGVTLDLGCHGLYILPMLCGRPKAVTCRMEQLYSTGADEISSTIIEFENGAMGTAFTSYVSYRMDNLLEIVGTEGILVISGSPESCYTVLLQSKHVPGHEKLSPVPPSEIPQDGEFPILQFMRLVESDQREVPGYDMETAGMLTRLIECAYASSKEGKTVQF